MELVQVRLPKKLIEEIDAQVSKGRHASKSDFIRDAIRKEIHSLVGIIPNTGDSVEEVRAIRKTLIYEDLDPDALNALIPPQAKRL